MGCKPLPENEQLAHPREIIGMDADDGHSDCFTIGGKNAGAAFGWGEPAEQAYFFWRP